MWKETETKSSEGRRTEPEPVEKTNCHCTHKYTVSVYTSNAHTEEFPQPSARNNFLILIYT